MKKKLKLTFILVNREISGKLIKYLTKKGYSNYFLFYGKGSASSTILDYLGIGETENNVIVYPSGEEEAISIMNHVKESEFLKHAIVFRVPVKGISSAKSLNYLLKGVSNHE